MTWHNGSHLSRHCTAYWYAASCWLHLQGTREVDRPQLATRIHDVIFSLLKSWVTQNFITIKTSWNTND
jgi:hypothetical protein